MQEGEEGRKMLLHDGHTRDPGRVGLQEMRGHKEHPKQKGVPRKPEMAAPVPAPIFSKGSPCQEPVPEESV